jgi:hypothetical protein
MQEEIKTYPVSREIAGYCRAVRDGTFRSARLLPLPSPAVSLAGGMPPVREQSFSSTCTAHAVADLVAYAENPQEPPRLSAQFIFDMAKRAEAAWIGKNLDSLRCGFDPDAEFLLAYRKPCEQLKLLVAANGGPRSAAGARFIAQFEEQLRGRTGESCGSMLHRCFEVVREYGVCREELCPDATLQRLSFAGRIGSSQPPRSVLDDALRHRVGRGLHVFEHPNSVNEVRTVLAGARNLRPMPVCAAVDIFEGRTGGGFSFPEAGGGDSVTDAPLGLHEMLIVGYEDDPAEPGGGRFTVRNSWGPSWGNGGYGTMPYAYFEVFCREAGTILAYAAEPQAAAAVRAAHGDVCGSCGRRYLSASALGAKCEAEGCGAKICFDCRVRLGVRFCADHAENAG